jgi:hypothetical protein
MLLMTIGFHLPAGAAAVGAKGEKKVAVIGTGDISSSTVSKAREAAITDSLISAVKTVAADLLPVEALVAHFPTLNQVLFENPQQFIDTYKVMTEYKHGARYRVLVQATVQVEKVVDHLSGVGIIQQETSLPKVLFFITEQNPDTAMPQYWWSEQDKARYLVTAGEKSMGEVLRKKGFAVVDHTASAAAAPTDAVVRKPNLANTEAAEIGTHLEADVVVIGMSTARDTLNTMGGERKSFKGTITVRAVRTDTSEVIASAVQSAVAVNTDTIEGGRAAIAAAGKSAAEQLVTQMTTAWRKKSAGTEMLLIAVTGTRNLSGFVKLRKMLSNTSGINGIQVKEIRGDQATLLVDYPGSADQLADTLMLNDFESFGINITDIGEGRLDVEIMSQPNPAEPE